MEKYYDESQIPKEPIHIIIKEKPKVINIAKYVKSKRRSCLGKVYYKYQIILDPEFKAFCDNMNK